jgi:F0F1-type ATP synthase gamma subunit
MNEKTRIVYENEVPDHFNQEIQNITTEILDKILPAYVEVDKNILMNALTDALCIFMAGMIDPSALDSAAENAGKVVELRTKGYARLRKNLNKENT